MNMFSTPRKLDSSPETAPPPANSNTTPRSATAKGILSSGVTIKGSVKFRNELLIDGNVEGTIDSVGKLTVGEHAQIRGEIRTGSVSVHGTVEGNITALERCALMAGSKLHGDIEAPRLVVDENASFVGSAKISPQGNLPSSEDTKGRD